MIRTHRLARWRVRRGVDCAALMVDLVSDYPTCHGARARPYDCAADSIATPAVVPNDSPRNRTQNAARHCALFRVRSSSYATGRQRR